MLRERLIEIYVTGTPDTLSFVLGSESWADVGSRAEYLSQIQDHDDAVADRVEGLRDEARESVERMAAIRLRLERARDTIAAKEREAEATSEEAAARFAELKAAQAERQEALDALQSREAALSDNLASISEQIADAGGTPPASAPAPLTPGQEAQFISEAGTQDRGAAARRPGRSSQSTPRAATWGRLSYRPEPCLRSAPSATVSAKRLLEPQTRGSASRGATKCRASSGDDRLRRSLRVAARLKGTVGGRKRPPTCAYLRPRRNTRAQGALARCAGVSVQP